MENTQTIFLAAGCFWCTEAVFQRIKGVKEVKSGYTGGHIKNPAYREVCTGRTGHAEGVRVVYDTDEISLQQLLEVFFATHDPTTLNRQGNDRGTQYRSGIFYTTEAQREISEAFIKKLDEASVFENEIVTEVTPLDVVYEADESHDEYYNRYRAQPYCQIIIDPKIDKIKTYFKDVLKS